MSLWAELRRRNVIRMAGLYLVTAWLVVQVAQTMLPIYDTPGWVIKALIALLAIGFVPTVVFAWLYELTPEGLKRDHEVARENSIAARTGRRMDQLTIAALLAVAALVLADRYWPHERESGSPSGTPATTATDAIAPEGDSDSLSAAGQPATSAPPKQSIAVMAFADLSPGKDQEYFSDGIAEEILNALARVEDLKVTGRTSAFRYKGRNEDLREIGRALGVAHILEGSVRKQGDKVRITAQLVQAEDGFHLWSQTFDGDLSDVFELQEAIARTITDKLEVILQEDVPRRLVPAATSDPEAYGLYLQANGIYHRREGARFAEAIAWLEQALARDPTFARAHARLAAMHVILPAYVPTPFVAAMQAADAHAQRAIALDPALAEPHAVMAAALAAQRRDLEALAEFERALALDPSDITTNLWFAHALITRGYARRGNERLDRVLELDPMLPNALAWRAWGHINGGEIEDAERLLRRAADAGLSYVALVQSDLAERLGRNDEAIALYAEGSRAFFGEFPPEAPELLARGAFGDAQARARMLALIDEYLARGPATVSGQVVSALIRLGEPERALAILQGAPTSGDASAFVTLWSSHGAAARRLPQFAEFARRTGLADWWDIEGPPDACRKADNGDYVCE